jgi:hypothetical protein
MTVVGVVAGSGGAGASSLAAVFASAVGAMLVDLDPVGGGLDVLLLAGGTLDPRALADGLPQWGAVPVLAADAFAPSVGQVQEVLDAAVSWGDVVIDLPRTPSAERDTAAMRCALVVVVALATVRGLVAAQALVASLPDVPVGLILRPGEVPAGEVGAYVAAPVLGTLRRPVGSLEPGRRRPRAATRLAEGVFDGLVQW